MDEKLKIQNKRAVKDVIQRFTIYTADKSLRSRHK